MERTTALREYCLQMALELVGEYDINEVPLEDIETSLIWLARELEKYILQGC